MNEQISDCERTGENAAAEFLQEKAIYAVRLLARALGVPKPSLYKKAALMEMILQKAAEMNWAEYKAESISAETAADLQALQKIVCK